VTPDVTSGEMVAIKPEVNLILLRVGYFQFSAAILYFRGLDDGGNDSTVMGMAINPSLGGRISYLSCRVAEI
jgi:hypothetical protein